MDWSVVLSPERPSGWLYRMGSACTLTIFNNNRTARIQHGAYLNLDRQDRLTGLKNIPR